MADDLKSLEEKLAKFREVRDQIQGKIREWVGEKAGAQKRA